MMGDPSFARVIALIGEPKIDSVVPYAIELGEFHVAPDFGKLIKNLLCEFERHGRIGVSVKRPDRYILKFGYTFPGQQTPSAGDSGREAIRICPKRIPGAKASHGMAENIDTILINTVVTSDLVE